MEEFEVKHLQTGDLVLEKVHTGIIEAFFQKCYYNSIWIPVKNKIHVCVNGVIQVNILDWAVGREVCILRPIYRLSQDERTLYVEYANSIIEKKTNSCLHAITPINKVRGWFPNKKIDVKDIRETSNYYIVRFEGFLK